MKNLTALSTLGAAAAFLGTGCIIDSGPAKAQSVSVSGFDAIDFRGAGQLDVTVGEKESVEITGSEKRVENVTAEVVDGVLVIKENSKGIFGSRGDLTITVTVPELKAVDISGAGDIDVQGIDSPEFDFTLSGAGDIRLEGRADTVSITCSGAGDLDAEDLKAKNLELSVSGAGDADVYASENISISVSGVGDVTYFGDPNVKSKSVSGIGDIEAG